MVAARHIRAFQIMGQLWLFPWALFIAVPAAECSFVVSPASNNPPCWKYRQLYALLLWGPLDTTRERERQIVRALVYVCIYNKETGDGKIYLFTPQLERGAIYSVPSFCIRKREAQLMVQFEVVKKNSIEKAHPEERDTWPNSHIFLRHQSRYTCQWPTKVLSYALILMSCCATMNNDTSTIKTSSFRQLDLIVFFEEKASNIQCYFEGESCFMFMQLMQFMQL